MKILVVGAGALGGYYGTRLQQAHRDVTFLLRDKRIAQLKKTKGLHVQSAHGNITLSDIKYLTKDQITEPFDLIIVSCKAYSLQNCINDFARAVGENTLILPILNGIKHIDALSQRFGKQHILGGLAIISATLDAEGNVIHLNKNHDLTFGELDGQNTSRIQAITQTLKNAGFNANYSPNIMQAMWNKWIMIATAAGATSLFRAAICDIVNADGTPYITQLLDECISIAGDYGYPPDQETSATLHKNLTSPENQLMASMLKDIEKGYEIESDAIIDDFIRRASPEQHKKLIMLHLVNTHLKTYLNRYTRNALITLSA